MSEPRPDDGYRAVMRACADAIGLHPPEIVLPTDHWAEINGITTHYLDWGNPHLPHLVLLHGGGLTAHTWDMAALLLRDRYHVIAPDQRGHGDSGWTPDQQAHIDPYDLMLTDTRIFLDHLAFDRMALCGMSMGALNAIRYASRHPGRLQALAIVDVGPRVMREGRLEMARFRRETETLSHFDDFLDRAIQFNPQRHPAHLRYSLLHSLKRVDSGWTWKQDLRGGTRDDDAVTAALPTEMEERARWMSADLRAIKIPTLLIRGEISNMLPPDAAAEVVELMDDCELATIPGAGHSVQGDNPVAFARTLDEFLSRQLG
ncbi:MAG: alpha/beta hydrolase [Dehalococcoidia bacterium]|nr:MAG: alpha/beta hydrolase [Dehalococcoidia bacterium]